MYNVNGDCVLERFKLFSGTLLEKKYSFCVASCFEESEELTDWNWISNEPYQFWEINKRKCMYFTFSYIIIGKVKESGRSVCDVT